MSKKSKRSLLSMFIMALVCVFTFTFVGCKDKTDDASEQAAVVWTIEKAYAQAQSEGFTGTYEEFLKNLSSISEIALDDAGNLTFTLSNGTVIVAGTITSGAPGRGIEDVITETDRWGLVITNTYVFSDGGTATSSYSTKPMYGREYDIEDTEELDYLVENGVKNIILANDVGSVEEDYENTNIFKGVKINLNQKTFYAKELTLSSTDAVEIGFENGFVQTMNGLDVSAANGTVAFNNVYSLDKNGSFKLNASSQSIHFSGDGCFAKGEMKDYLYMGAPELARVAIPADTKVVFEEDARFMLERIVVEEVENSKLVVLNKSVYDPGQGIDSVKVEGDVLAYGAVEVVQADEGETHYELTVATVAINETLYTDMNDVYPNIMNGDMVFVIGETSWNIEGENNLVVAKEFTVYYVGGTISGGNWATKVVPAVGYVKEEVKMETEPGAGEQVVGFRFALCTEHTPNEGYCEDCQAEIPGTAFVAMVGNRKYLSLDKALAVSTTVKLISGIELGTAETPYVIDKEFTIVRNGYTVTFTNVEYAKDTTEHTAYYLDDSNEAEYRFVLCNGSEDNKHTYSYDYCTKCGYQDPSKTYVAKIGDREYSSIESILEQGHQYKQNEEDPAVVVELLADTTWTLIADEIIDYELTIKKGEFDLTIEDRYYEYQGETYDKLFFMDSYYLVETKAEFKFVKCPGHVYEKTLGDDETLYIGYCQTCGKMDESLQNTAQIEVDGVRYLSLQNFVDQGKLKNGIGTIKLLRNATLTLREAVTVDFEITIDYNGKTVTGNPATWILPDEGFHADVSVAAIFKIVADEPQA